MLDDRARNVLDAAMARPRPESTYRLQFHAGFTFRDAMKIVPYLRDLGITHVYASPYLKARPGSTHGYDIVDHRQLNPEVGTREDFDAWTAALHDAGLGQILDIVPNHMGVATDENPWWNDVIENGPASRFAGHFDIDWSSSDRDDLRHRVLLPVLGDNYGEALEAGQFKLRFEVGTFRIEHFDRHFPVAPKSYTRILAVGVEELGAALGPDSADFAEYQSIITAVNHLPDRTETDPAKLDERLREKEVIKRRLRDLVGRNETVRRFIDEALVQINGTPGDPNSFDRLDDLLRHQCHRLAHWRVATDEINYRRFFDVNELAALSMERDDVFRAAHELIFELLASGAVDGLRIDHPDGLYNPREYFERLQSHFLFALARRLGEWDEYDLSDAIAAIRKENPAPLYVVVEKILAEKESLPDDWPVAGTSGYEFINVVNGLFVDSEGERTLTRVYREFHENYSNWREEAYRAKRIILQASLASELHTVARRLERLARKGRRSRDFTFNSLREALREVIACFPVYRTYITDSGAISPADRNAIETAVHRAARRNPLTGRPIFDFIRRMLLLDHPDGSTEEDWAEQRRFVGKFQQVTSPVLAKGLEDTAFYRYARLLSLNEVGGDPSRFGVPPDIVHRFCVDRRDRWPRALSPLSTHDTKRSEDVRARLNLLAEMPEEWGRSVRTWSELNAGFKTALAEGPAPDPNDEYLIYQTLLGAWPLESRSEEAHAEFTERIQAYMQKAIHEAKVHTSWVNPNSDYDDAVRAFIGKILGPEGKPFLDAFHPLRQRIARLGLFNSLSQTLLRLTLPGVPDTYQGTELWDFSLVDPDNRRPVDYPCRQKLLESVQSLGADALPELVRDMADSRIKLFVVNRVLNLRRKNPGLFTGGDHVPLRISGEMAEHAFAFKREWNGVSAVVVVPRLIAKLCPGEDAPLGEVWRDTALDFQFDGEWTNAFTGEPFAGGPARLAALFARFPVALLITSRPSVP